MSVFSRIDIVRQKMPFHGGWCPTLWPVIRFFSGTAAVDRCAPAMVSFDLTIKTDAPVLITYRVLF